LVCESTLAPSVPRSSHKRGSSPASAPQSLSGPAKRGLMGAPHQDQDRNHDQDQNQRGKAHRRQPVWLVPEFWPGTPALAPRRGTSIQPRATPWVRSRVTRTALKGRVKSMSQSLARLHLHGIQHEEPCTSRGTPAMAPLPCPNQSWHRCVATFARQPAHHRVRTFEDEIRALLERPRRV